MQEKEPSAADFALYWAMVGDHVIERDPEIEKKYEAFIASRIE